MRYRRGARATLNQSQKVICLLRNPREEVGFFRRILRNRASCQVKQLFRLPQAPVAVLFQKRTLAFMHSESLNFSLNIFLNINTRTYWRQRYRLPLRPGFRCGNVIQFLHAMGLQA